MSHPDPHDPDVDVVCSLSGGKDSAALSLWFTEQGIPHRRVFADTGWEKQSTLDHVNRLEEYLGPIDWVRAPRQFADQVRHGKMFPHGKGRWCTRKLKGEPIAAYLADLNDPINAVGMRAAESKKRAAMTEWEWSKHYDAWTWRPLLGWSTDDVVAIHQRHGVPPNSLYLLGPDTQRVGCWPCIYAKKSDIALVDRLDPDRINEIRALEAETGLTFFHSKGGAYDAGPMPIDKAVEWARTSHGGRQFELFTDPHDGCMRWGLCEQEPGE